MKTAKLFKIGKRQAVRLSKGFRFWGREVFIKRAGSAVVLFPTAKSWDTLLHSLDKFPPDFMSKREQPPTLPNSRRRLPHPHPRRYLKA